MELVSIRELARRLGVSDVTIRRKIKAGVIPEEAFVYKEGNKTPKLDFDAACFALDALGDAGRSMASSAKKEVKIEKSVPKKQAPKKKAEPKKAKDNGNAKLATEKKNVEESKPDDKPKENESETSKHDEQLKEQMLDGLVLDEASGLYLADDVEIEELEGKRIVTAKDVLLSNAQRYQKHRALTEALKAEQLQMKLDIDKGKLVDGDELKKRIFKIGIETRDAILNVPEQFGPDLLGCKSLDELQTTLAHALNKALENLRRL